MLSTLDNTDKEAESSFKQIATDTTAKSEVNATLDTDIWIKINSLTPDPDHPRKFFAPDSLEQLKNSIESLNSVTALEVRENPEKPGTYFILDGVRRWIACKELGYTQIKCNVRDPFDFDPEIYILSFNIHREDLTIMEKALAVGKAFVKMKLKRPDFQQKDLVPILHLSDTNISEMIAISKLDGYIINDALKSNLWSKWKLMCLASTKDTGYRFEKYEAIKDKIDAAQQRKADSKEKDVDETDHGVDDLSTQAEIAHVKRSARMKKYVKNLRVKVAKYKKSNPRKKDIDNFKSDIKLLTKELNRLLRIK
ncbi:MAG: ParB/RepB/Spo0J family partition protein [Deltaproteobacteria bacterium]|jgi:ParB/RepB/Spo0J family partition protein|nr:ParB/RepB/Spo0J family partition protein [Deltaproteobacteria bacterium]